MGEAQTQTVAQRAFAGLWPSPGADGKRYLGADGRGNAE
jgi:hypothetical protein